MKPPTNAGNESSIPGSGRSLEKKMATHSSILASILLMENLMDRGAQWTI